MTIARFLRLPLGLLLASTLARFAAGEPVERAAVSAESPRGIAAPALPATVVPGDGEAAPFSPTPDTALPLSASQARIDPAAASTVEAPGAEGGPAPSDVDAARQAPGVASNTPLADADARSSTLARGIARRLLASLRGSSQELPVSGASGRPSGSLAPARLVSRTARAMAGVPSILAATILPASAAVLPVAAETSSALPGWLPWAIFSLGPIALAALAFVDKPARDADERFARGIRAAAAFVAGLVTAVVAGSVVPVSIASIALASLGQLLGGALFMAYGRATDASDGVRLAATAPILIIASFVAPIVLLGLISGYAAADLALGGRDLASHRTQRNFFAGAGAASLVINAFLALTSAALSPVSMLPLALAALLLTAHQGALVSAARHEESRPAGSAAVGEAVSNAQARSFFLRIVTLGSVVLGGLALAFSYPMAAQAAALACAPLLHPRLRRFAAAQLKRAWDRVRPADMVAKEILAKLEQGHAAYDAKVNDAKEKVTEKEKAVAGFERQLAPIKTDFDAKIAEARGYNAGSPDYNAARGEALKFKAQMDRIQIQLDGAQRDLGVARMGLESVVKERETFFNIEAQRLAAVRSRMTDIDAGKLMKDEARLKAEYQLKGAEEMDVLTGKSNAVLADGQASKDAVNSSNAAQKINAEQGARERSQEDEVDALLSSRVR